MGDRGTLLHASTLLHVSTANRRYGVSALSSLATNNCPFLSFEKAHASYLLFFVRFLLSDDPDIATLTTHFRVYAVAIRGYECWLVSGSPF